MPTNIVRKVPIFSYFRQYATVGAFVLSITATSFAQAPTSQPSAASLNKPSAPLSLDADDKPPSHKAYPGSRGIGSKRVRDLPLYAKSFEPFWEPDAKVDWLIFGMQHRTRYENRDDFFRSALDSDERFMLRSRGFVGIKDVLDPFRLGVEFLDARALSNDFPELASDVDHADFLQAFVELYFENVGGSGQPVSLRFGRQAFDLGDRRLFARNRWPNNSNAFDGFRLRIGDEASEWEVEAFAFQPVDRRFYSPNPNNEDVGFYGVIGYFRKWSPYVTFEPYYFVLDEDLETPGSIDSERHTLGLRAFGLIGKTGFDYDLNTVFQFGDTEVGDIRAFGFAADVGYQFDHPWKPRVAAMFQYASGDNDPTDRLDEGFDPLFGAPHPFLGFSDNFVWSNIMNPALYVSAKPTDKLGIVSVYRAYWLESDVDSFPRAGIVDPTGTSGNFIGQELDIQVNYRIDEHTTLETGFAHFMPGTFTRSAGDDITDSDFFYVQMEISY